MGALVLTERHDLIRLMPDGTDNLLPYLTPAFWDAYGIVCAVMLVGDNHEEAEGYGRSKKRSGGGSPIRDERCFRIKAETDKFLSATSKALRRWTEAGPRKRHPRPKAGGGMDVPGVGPIGHRAGVHEGGTP